MGTAEYYDHLSKLEEGINRLLLFEIWNDSTRSELNTYLKLMGVEEYIVSDLCNNRSLSICIKLDGRLHMFSIP